MFKQLPYELVHHIYSYDNSPQIYYKRCLEELKMKFIPAKYNEERLYEIEMYFKPTNHELNQMFYTSKNCKSIYKGLFTFKNTEFFIYKSNIQVTSYDDNNNLNMLIYNIFYLSKKTIDYKKELLINVSFY
jgi:hypothetical protein